MKIHVQIVQGPAANQSFYVEKDSRFIVGRGESANFQIEDDELLSREHFALDFDGDQLTLSDLGSTNGTFVNGHPLTHRPVILKDNQPFVAGRVSRFIVQFVGQLEKKADAKTTPSVAAPPSSTPTPPVPVPPSNPNTNFGASIYSAGEAAPTSQAPPPAASGNEGGNFSQSIVTGFSDSAGPEQGSLLYSNPPSPTPSIAQPPKKKPGPPPTGLPDRGELPTLPQNAADDDYGSIAVPGGSGFPETFAPLGGSQPNVPLTQVPPPEDNVPGLPGFEPAAPAEAAESPFASVHQPAPSQPPPVPPQPIEVEPPKMRQEVPTDAMPPVESVQNPSPAAGSIYVPGQMPTAPAANTPPTQASIGHAGSIGMPNQIAVAQPRRAARTPVQAELPPGQIGFQVRHYENGLFFHGGTNAADVERIKNIFSAKFEAVFCAHLSRAEIEKAPSEPVEKPQVVQADLGASPFEDFGDDEDIPPKDDSPFETLDEAAEEQDPTPEPKQPESPKIGEPLFSWFPKESRWENPVLLTNDEFKFSMKELWQMDALVCLFGSSSKQITEHCHELVQMNLKTGKKGGLFGFCWPSVLDSVLESQGQKAITRIFAGGVAAILLEDPQEEFAWNIVSRTDMTQPMIEAGLVLIPNQTIEQ